MKNRTAIIAFFLMVIVLAAVACAAAVESKRNEKSCVAHGGKVVKESSPKVRWYCDGWR